MRTAHYRCFYIDLTQTRHMHYVAFNILDGLFRLKLYGKNMIQAMDAVDTDKSAKTRITLDKTRRETTNGGNMGTESQAWINADNQWNTILDLQIELDETFSLNGRRPHAPDVRNTEWRSSTDILIDWMDDIITGIYQTPEDERDEATIWHLHGMYQWRSQATGSLGYIVASELDTLKAAKHKELAQAFHRHQ